ncbi:MAG: acyl-CoA dehydrogenase [Legionellales bacterium RIFCSPHIGHO2_12_FULL_37_14]|nr:MAG: acyl-CoA dehydrogenase [Legionellales bacterium RIFCSPHIGHO2_12_FULL_37_14]
MDFDLTESQLSIAKMAQTFAVEKLIPNAQKWDQESYFPTEVLRDAASLGMGAMNVSLSNGGSGLSRLDGAIIYEQLATGCISTAAYLSIHNMVVCVIDKYANSALNYRYKSKLASMEWLASYCLTEPEAGSDAAALKTKAEKKGDNYIINGSKAFISGGSVSDVYLCMVRTSEDKHRGISCFLIDKNTKGLSFGAREKKMGWKSQPTTMVFFENCEVAASNMVGEEGMGFSIALNALNGGRINIAACSLGGALACLKQTKQYMQERKQFKQELKKMQALRFIYAKMLSRYEAAKLMVFRAAHALDNNNSNAPYYCAMAKRVATENAFQIADKALQLHGGYGYLQEYNIERIFRDLRVHRILEGTNEIMYEIIAKAALDKDEVEYLT